MRNRFTTAILASVVLIGSLAIAPAPAQDSLEQSREQLEQVRAEAAAAAEELDLLAAEDEEVAQALADLEAFISATDADIDAAEDLIAQAEADAIAADEAAAAMETDIELTREQLTDLAVSAYVDSGDDDTLDILSSDDPSEAEIRQHFVDVAGGNADTVIGDLRVLQDDQEALKAQAEDARAAAEAARVEAEEKKVELEEAVVAQEEIKAAIEARISDWESEAAALNAQDAEITAFIQAEEARIERERLAAIAAAEAEAKRKAEEEAAAEAARQAEAERLAQEAAEREAAEAAAAQAGDDDTQSDGDAEPTPDPTATPAPDATPDPTPDPTPAATPAPSVGFIWPVNGAVTSGYGYRIHPIFGTSRMHSGLDINGSSGTPIAASASGTVIKAGWSDGYGNTVIIQHEGGISTLYAHQSSIAVSNGQAVNQGQVIGYVGSTGWSTGPHLHFEVRVNGAHTDPMAYL